MTFVDPSDLRLILPELILAGMSLVLLLVARRIRTSALAPAATVLAALAAGAVAAATLTAAPETGFGGWIARDGYAAFFKLLISAALALTALLALRPIDGEEVPRGEFHVLLLLAATGMMLAVCALDLLTLYLGLELTTLASIVLVGVTVRSPRSNEAAIKYFLIASLASAILLYGISLTYGLTGGTDFATIAAALGARGGGADPLAVAAVALVVAGLAFKIAAVPFHAWAPDAYQGASPPVAAFLAAASKAAGVAALGRVTLVAFAPRADLLGDLLAGLAALSIVVGSVVAVAQTDVRRLLAYSSIAHAGFALLGLLGGTPEGARATMTYAFFYVFMTLGAFGVVVALDRRGERLEGFRGLARQRPRTAAAMLLFLLALTGIPPTSGFVAKWVVIVAALQAGHTALALLAVACSVVAAFVYLRIAVLMFMDEAEEAAPAALPVTIGMALGVAASITLAGGLYPRGVIEWTVSP